MQENPNTPENENDISQNDLFPDESLSDKDLSENNTASTDDDNFLDRVWLRRLPYNRRLA